MEKRWTHSNKSTFNLGYHIVWCPKYRRAILIGDVEKDLKELILKKAKEINVSIEKMEVMPDHIHLFVKSEPIDSPHWIVQQLKGYTSRILREKHKHLRTKLPTLWTRSYFCESVGHISEDTIIKYIEEQKNK
jgi:putative transposase